jgi:aspartate-semialdehyde dehydrogenase
MKPGPQGFRVAVVGASSLLGKELLNTLEERKFPVSRLVTLEADEEEPNLPIVDLQERSQATVSDEEVTEAGLDFAFLAACPTSGAPSFLRPGGTAAAHGEPGQASHCVVIDLSESLKEREGRILSIPFLERAGCSTALPRGERGNKVFVSAHPAAIVLSSLLLRIVARFPVRSALANVFVPASESGPRGIEELQRQTVNLLGFQKVPEAVFGAQLAFNLLPRLGRSGVGALSDLETRVRKQLREYLGERVPPPALRLFQAPVFYSLAFSLYVETAQAAPSESLAKALEGEHVRVRRPSQHAPSPVEAAGGAEILVDAIAPDPDHAGGAWIWATADNLCLAALNAVEIAESLR